MLNELILPVLWGTLVGLVFSTVGIAGAILASVGHISIFGMKDANLVKVYNQSMVLFSGLISSPIYFKQKRIVLFLALFIGIGSIVGAILGSMLSYIYLADMKRYKFLLGILTFLIALKIVYEALFKGKSSANIISKELMAKLDRFTLVLKSNEYHKGVNILSPLSVGFAVGFISAAMGIGGGFLFAAYMILVLRLPTYFVPGTAILLGLITTITSVSSYTRLGVDPDLHFLASELFGVFFGSLLGPHISKKLGERRLKLAIGLILLYVGVGYTFGDWIKNTTGIRII